MRNRMLVLLCLLVPTMSMSGWFDWGSKDEAKPAAEPAGRRYVLKIPNKAVEQELIRLIALKQNCVEDILVMARLAQKKKLQLDKVKGGLREAFTMDPSRNYQYDPKTRTIYELTASASAPATNPPPGATTVPPAGFSRELHLQLTTDQQVQQFLRLTAARKLVEDEIKVFVAVIREKQVEVEGAVRLLRDKFSISKDRNYEYEPSTRRLYDIGAPAVPTKAPAAGSSAIQLRATLPQQVAVPEVDELQEPVPLR